MSEKETENGKNPQSNEPSGLSFAVTLFAALGTVLYAVYNYVQTTPIDPLGYVLFPILISAVPILVGGLLLYILIKGFSMEVHYDPNQKIRLNDKASSIYLITFFISTVLFTFLLVYSVCAFFLAYLILLSPNLKNEIMYIVAPIVASIVILCISIFFVHVFELQDKIPLIKEILTKIHSYLVRVKFFVRAFKWCEKKLQSMNSYSVGFLIAIVIFAIILIIVPNLAPLQGHVTVDMESIYYKNDTPIPVLVHVTGPNPDLEIKLQNSTKVYNFTLTPECNLSKTEFRNNSILIGNALNYGTYNVFINTTNLSAGYYELVCKRPKYEKTYGVRGFYLVNSSQQSCIKD